MRTIFHIDMDSYFATCEQQANPFLRGKPIAVSGHPSRRTVVAAASVEAKRFGVKSAMSIQEAKRLCPNLYFVLGDPEKYVHLTKKIINIFLSYTNLVEVVSIDEAFMDATDIQKRHGGAIKIAKEIKKRLKQEIGDWMQCSIGIAPNKTIAKLCSGLKKPNGLVVITEKEIPFLLKKIELTDLWGIGTKTKQRLALMNIHTTTDLQKTPLSAQLEKSGASPGYYKLQNNCLHETSKYRDQRKEKGHVLFSATTVPLPKIVAFFMISCQQKATPPLYRRI